MAFSMTGLMRIGGGAKNDATNSVGAPAVWTYRTTDALTAVDAAGYFDDGTTTNTGVRNLMSVGDMIILHCTADTIPTFGLAFVNSNASGIIDITNATAISIDSD